MHTFKSLILFIFIGFLLVNGKTNSADDMQTIRIKADGNQAMLGILIQEPEKDTKGALVVALVDDSPADKKGIKKNDRIVKADGKTIESADQLNEQSEKWKTDQKIDLTVVREGKTMQMTVAVEKIKNPTAIVVKSRMNRDDDDNDDGEDAHVFISHSDDDDSGNLVEVEKIIDGENNFKFSTNASKGGFLGINGKTLRGQLKEYFEVKQGVLVESIVDESPAKKSGLKAGDVITRINDRDIEDMDDLHRVLNYYNPGDKVKIYFVRKGEKKNMKLELAKKPNSGNAFWVSEGNNLKESLEKIKGTMPKMHKQLRKLKVQLKDIKESGLQRFYLI